MTPQLQQVLKQAEQLAPYKKLELIQKIAEGLKLSTAAEPKPKWRDLRGMAPYPIMGEDAQTWVSRTRQQSDEHREQILKERHAD
ncbi:MAG: hypothetical protein F6J97_04380 [Leptolyngbya sp. SIO4C1]|nr:hypothetical protein [Leptolyngbya sp. SIO4C1]